MEPASFGLIVSATFAALVTLGALHSALYAANGRLWEAAAWETATFIAMIPAGWCLARTLAGDRPEPLVAGLLAAAPLPVTLALIFRSWSTRPRTGGGAD